ncbi:SbcC/MukB-like Walker B domain-containing protein [Streptomyces sp. NPDC087212]|uniref:SbcC/MukB-like Walker B domain-containing protein n=1 Tax=Streptomyces sp. NPDC087212 TaxID=3365766 RepID=UPI0037F9A62E
MRIAGNGPVGAGDVGLGVPVAEGRWQPTRAGVVNSWAWAEEELLFADGWLTLAGPNGSGKSLSASMLVTVLLDADVSQTALSVSGKAAGTLLSRHTDRDEQQDRTGVWWLEYGRRTDGRAVEYVTTGLWLRAVGKAVHRVFFLARGRVGEQLRLQVDREPVRIGDLAAQLASCQGQAFTSSASSAASNRARLSEHLRVVGDEHDYRRAVREELFAPLDEVQFDALVGVLRSLRSVRTAEAISAAEMGRLLSSALPALDGERLTVIAQAMERISELEDQLERARAEEKLLQGAERAYRRYVEAVAVVEAASLIAANTGFDAQTRRERQASEEAQQAGVREAEAVELLAGTRAEIGELEGRKNAAEEELRGHAGAVLPQREQRAVELAAAAGAAAKRSDEVGGEASQAEGSAGESAGGVRSAQGAVSAVSGPLRVVGGRLGADAALEGLLALDERLVGAEAAAVAAGMVDEACAAPLAWVDTRLFQLRKVEAALGDHATAQGLEVAAAADLREAEGVEETDRAAANLAGQARALAEDALLEELRQWADAAVELRGPALELLVRDSRGDGERLSAGKLTAGLAQVAGEARARIDAAGHHRQAAADRAVAEQAAGAWEQARTLWEQKHSAAEHTSQALRGAQQEAKEQDAAEQKAREQHQETHRRQIAQAEAAVTQTQEAADGAGSAAVAAWEQWQGLVGVWRRDTVLIDAGMVPELAGDGTTVDAVQTVTQIQVSLERAHAAAAGRLQRTVDATDQAAGLAQETVRDLEQQLEQARQAAPVPPAPLWRSRQPVDGTPLWALVDFAEHLADEARDRLEGALLVSGLLDALVRADGQAVAGDVTLRPGPAVVSGSSLADVLRPDAQGRIAPERVHQLLRSIPLDPSAGDQVTITVATAVAPAGYQARFIGRSARERARLQHVADLEQQLDQAQEALYRAREEAARARARVNAAAVERDRFPSPAGWERARERWQGLLKALQETRNRSAEDIRLAERGLAQALHTLDTAAARRRTALELLAQETRHTEQVAATALAAARTAEGEARNAAGTAAASHAGWEQAKEAQAQADAEQAGFPLLKPVSLAQQGEDDATEQLQHSIRRTVDTRERHRRGGEAVRQALRALNRAADAGGGTVLPTAPKAADAHREDTALMFRQVEAWRGAARRVVDLAGRARQDAATAGRWRTLAADAAREAEQAAVDAGREKAAVEEMRRLHGAEYEELRASLQEVTGALDRARTRVEELQRAKEGAAADAASARARLDEVAPLRQAAEEHRDACLTQLGRLIDEGLALVSEDISTGPEGRPANLTAGLAWARHLLADRHTGPGAGVGADRLAAASRARDAALKTLEGAARTANSTLARFNRQVILTNVSGTSWQRAEVADPAAARGQDLRTAVEALRAAVAQLEQDLRADIKKAIKTSMFAQLQRDVQVRQDLAQQLVRQIGQTLEDVRTGVARVGVRVEWAVRKDADAKAMVELVNSPPSDEMFERMYDVLRQRMDESVGDTWADRVAHTFDYRAWHEWKISVTHSSFSNGGGDRFKEVKPRGANPLETLSTGERRLATMLPLLAAAWSMYSREYRGPRLLSIDELDAAFDDANLRQMLGLLRRWEFDVLATAPSMTPVIKKEAGQVVIHQVVTSGKHRVTVPWLWQGHGEAQPLTLDLGLGFDDGMAG